MTPRPLARKHRCRCFQGFQDAKTRRREAVGSRRCLVSKDGWWWYGLDLRALETFRGLDTNPMKSLICSCTLLFVSIVFSLGTSLDRLVLNKYIIYLPIHKPETRVQAGEPCAFQVHLDAELSTPLSSLPLSIILALRSTLDSLKLNIFITATLIHKATHVRDARTSRRVLPSRIAASRRLVA